MCAQDSLAQLFQFVESLVCSMKQQTRYWFGKKNDCKVSHTGADTVLTTGDANCRARADFFSNPLELSSGGAITHLAPFDALLYYVN